jgi:uncharacterized protein (UPF0332 family)
VLSDELRIVVKLRLDKSRDCLEAANNSLASGDFSTCANRSYYCIFHAIAAVLCTVGVSSKKHSGAISEFNRQFVKTGVFPVEFSSIVKDAFNVRAKSDYDYCYVISKSEVAEQADNAKRFLAGVEDYIETL